MQTSTTSDLSKFPTGMVLFSHVTNELESTVLRGLAEGLNSHQSFIRVEPGTLQCSESLVAAREILHATFSMHGPCPHQDQCPLLEDETNWCHQHLKPPAVAHTSAFWRDFSRNLGIDLRSLPVSYLAGSKVKSHHCVFKQRVIGAARVQKAKCCVTVCDVSGAIKNLEIIKRTHPQAYKKLSQRPLGLTVDPIKT